MTKKRNGNQSLASAIESAVGRMDRGGSGYRKALVVSAWENVAGPQIASHAHGAFLNEGELVVFMDSPVWATEMQAMAESFREAINSEIGREAVTSLRFTVSKRPARAAFVGTDALVDEEEEAETPLAELDDAEREAIERDAADVRDPRLREALIAARSAAERRKKGRETPIEPQEPREDL